jgi:hypothetical protein
MIPLVVTSRPDADNAKASPISLDPVKLARELPR